MIYALQCSFIGEWLKCLLIFSIKTEQRSTARYHLDSFYLYYIDGSLDFTHQQSNTSDIFSCPTNCVWLICLSFLALSFFLSCLLSFSLSLFSHFPSHSCSNFSFFVIVCVCCLAIYICIYGVFSVVHSSVAPLGHFFGLLRVCFESENKLIAKTCRLKIE